MDSSAYEDVEADGRATTHAAATVLLASLAAGVGLQGFGGTYVSIAPLSAFALLAWASWSLLTFEVGARLLPGARTHADVGELLRTLGFATSPALLLVAAQLPGLAVPVFLMVALWMLVAMIVAVRQALDYESTARAVAVCVVGWLLAIAVLAVGGFLFATPVSGQQLEPARPASADSLTGSVSFDLYCASCHGRTGEGNGPAAQSLRAAPGDLTLLARRNGGTFPRARVTATVDGSSGTAVHGGPDMPVWGPTFRALEPDDREAIRLRNVVAFVESIQRPASAAAAIPVDADGAALYRDYCTSCHGAKGLGAGPFTFALRTVPPNLTTLVQRNGGSFPRDRVSRLIEGADVRAHGDREMPVWGNVFRRVRPRDPGATARIGAVVDFLESIQNPPIPRPVR